MDPITIAIVSLRAAGLGLYMAGQSKIGVVLEKLATGLESGRNVDAQLAKTAELLAARDLTSSDWDAVVAGIESGSDRLQDDQPPGG